MVFLTLVDTTLLLRSVAKEHGKAYVTKEFPTP